jgi:short subunit fatty acids transporter
VISGAAEAATAVMAAQAKTAQNIMAIDKFFNNISPFYDFS